MMAKVAAAGEAPRPNRLDRRKARTRQALIDAAVRLIAEGRGERASIAEITEEADIGFGSFYNHFDSKEQLFGSASGELLEQVSDTTLRDPQIRRTVLAHAVLSYVFGVVIVAGSVNLISGLFR
jgi:AcrR family transcriptional regulator